jgi:hypothetical protein
MTRQTSAHRGSFRPQLHTSVITSEAAPTPPTPTPPPQSADPRRLRTSLGLCVVAATVAFAVICVLGHDTPARAQPPNAPTTTNRAGVNPQDIATQDVATRASSAEGADARGSTSADSGAEAAAWLAGGGQAELAALEDDFAHLVNDAQSAPGTATARFAQDCAHLADDAAAAQRAESIPDPQAQTSWSKALSAMHAGAEACLVGAVHADTAQLNQGLAQAAAGTADIHNAATRFEELIAPAHP